jgi:alanyl-tRNA synthetase
MDCKECKRLIKTVPLIKNKVINGEWAFHLHDSHGIPPDLLPLLIETILKKES